VSFSGEELIIDGKKHELKKEENNFIAATNAKRGREENCSIDTLRSNILHRD